MSASPSPQDSASGGVTTVVAVVVPILIVIVTAVVILLLVLAFLYYRSRQTQLDLDSKGAYAPLPLQEDSGSAPTPQLPPKTIPYGSPPTISLADPPNPNMHFTMATQLTDATKTGQRYPFMEQHKQPEGRTLRDTRPPKQRTKRKGNHKHLKSGSVDTSSDVSDYSSSGRSEVRPRSRQSPLAASVSPSDQEEAPPTAEIYLTLHYKDASSRFVVNVDRVVSLPARSDGTAVDSYVRLFVKPKLTDLSQRKTASTQTQKNQSSPVFNEEICYDSMSREELINCTLHVDVLDHMPHGKDQLLGNALVSMASVTFVEEEAAMRLALRPPEVRESRGSVNMSISYSPDTKRLSVIILRAKDLNRGQYKETEPQARLTVTLGGERVLAKLKTRRKPQSCGPIFNEVLNCSVDPSKMSAVAVNVDITNEHKQARSRALGQVTLCAQSTGDEFRHWSEVMAAPGKPIAEWHELR